jgi:hypothetical protein
MACSTEKGEKGSLAVFMANRHMCHSFALYNDGFMKKSGWTAKVPALIEKYAPAKQGENS